MFMKCKVTVDTFHYPKEGPWELSEGWCWTTIGAVFNLQAGKFVSAEDIHEKSVQYPYRCFGGNGIRGYVSLSNRLGNFPIIGRQGALCGNINYASGEFYATEHAVVVESLGGTDPTWARYLLEQLNLNQYATATAQPGLSVKTINEVAIPLPPIREQREISNAIARYLAIIADLHDTKESLRAEIGQMKSRILDLAIHGKLVHQDPSDEPAMKLLKRINPGFTPSHNLHYEGVLPIGWSLTRLGDVIDIISGTSYHKSDIVQIKSGIRILRGGNIQNGKIVLRDDDVFVHERLSATYLSPCRGDIALVASTGSSELIGKSAIAEIDYPNTQIGAFLRIIRPKAIELAEYLGVIFQSNYYKNHIRDVAKGTNINNIKSIYITDFVVPIPPIDEQRRILQHLKALFTIANQISDSIDESK